MEYKIPKSTIRSLIDVLKECKIFKCRRKPYFSISKLLRTRNYSNPVYDKKGIKKIPLCREQTNT